MLREKFFCLLVNSTVKHVHQSHAVRLRLHGVEQVATPVRFSIRKGR